MPIMTRAGLLRCSSLHRHLAIWDHLNPRLLPATLRAMVFPDGDQPESIASPARCFCPVKQ